MYKGGSTPIPFPLKQMPLEAANYMKVTGHLSVAYDPTNLCNALVLFYREASHKSREVYNYSGRGYLYSPKRNSL